MQIKITDQIVFIPPYISTTWEAIASLHMDKETLIICLKDGKEIAIPNLNPTLIEKIFSSHVAYLEKAETELQHQKEQPLPPRIAEMEHLLNQPFVKMSMGALEGIGQALQHNPQHKNLPPINDDVANKISALANAMSPDDIDALPDPETGCNCLYCQITRILKHGAPLKENLPDHPMIGGHEDESVTDEDLRFEQWIVEPMGEKVYLVTNKLDTNESYRVWLGDTIGCTCGKPNCEHIVAVLRA